MAKRTLQHMLAEQELLHAPAATDVQSAAVRMAEKNVAAILVVEGAELIGIFTERDLLRRVVASGLDPSETTIGDVMTTDVACLDASASGFEAVRVMHERQVRHLVVRGLDNGTGYGVVSVRDFLSSELAVFERELEFEERVWEEI